MGVMRTCFVGACVTNYTESRADSVTFIVCRVQDGKQIPYSTLRCISWFIFVTLRVRSLKELDTPTYVASLRPEFPLCEIGPHAVQLSCGITEGLVKFRRRPPLLEAMPLTGETRNS